MTEFKDALDALNKAEAAEDGCLAFGSYMWPFRKQLRRALLIADRLMQEPSEAMVIEGEAENEESWSLKTAEMVFKAMRDQLIREIDDANQ